MKESTHSKQLQRPKLSRERICLAALDLAQSQGLARLSMRQVARALGVEAMSLYKHVENKDDLLDGVIEQIVRKIELPSEAATWREALRRRALSERKVLSEHAWVIHLLETRSGTGGERLSQQNHMIGVLRQSGFPIDLAFRTMIILTGYVYGFAVFATAWNPASKERAKSVRKAQFEIRTEAHPYVLEAIHYAQSRAQQPGHGPDDFEFGLDILLDGIAARLEASNSAQS